MNKKEYIEHWMMTAERDWKAVKNMFKSKDYIHALFFAHLVLEKLCKANWIKDTAGNHPPRIHNLVRLAEEIKFNFTDEDLDFMRRMNDFHLEGRYSDYKDDLYRSYKQVQTDKILKEVNRLRKCLLEKLQ